MYISVVCFIGMSRVEDFAREMSATVCVSFFVRFRCLHGKDENTETLSRVSLNKHRVPGSNIYVKGEK